jgi:hydrogenase-4 component F
MTGLSLIVALLLTPLITSLAAFAARRLGDHTQRAAETVHLVGITIVFGLTIAVIDSVLRQQTLVAASGWLFVDVLGVIFVGLVGLVGLLTGIYSVGYLRHDLSKGEISAVGLSTYYGFFNLFLFTMMLIVTSNHIIMMWVGVEASTLASVFLVGFYGRKASLEAAWKYVVICTVGVAFGLFGTVLIFSTANETLGHAESAVLWTEVVKNASSLDPSIVSIAFVFVLIGFGTKAGLFPMHTWMPDAYAEAPSPASALLSAALSNCALSVIIRYAVIATQAGQPHFPRTLFLIFGVISIGVAALFIAVQRDVKRMLAYSSVENMGLAVLGLGLAGPLGTAAALLHVINHSLVKALLFCCSGNILMKYGTRDLTAIKGMLRAAPLSGLLLLAGALALAGAPPFNIFVSELMTVIAGVKAGYSWLMVICLLLLTIVLTALVRMISGSILGPAPQHLPKGDVGALALLPLGVLLALVLLMGLHVPRPISELIADATEVVLHGTRVGTIQTSPSKPLGLIDGFAWSTGMEAPRRRGGEQAVLRCISLQTEVDATCPK